MLFYNFGKSDIHAINGVFNDKTCFLYNMEQFLKNNFENRNTKHAIIVVNIIVYNT